MVMWYEEEGQIQANYRERKGKWFLGKQVARFADP